jgi:myo-inositol 2-dehydrogenase / D-chiro-inositol 1-dehydrogenase
VFNSRDRGIGMKDIKVGIIGAGPRGRALLRAVQHARGIAAVALAEPDETTRRQAEQLAPDAMVFSDGLELISTAAVDAVIIATPNHLHKASCLAAMDADLPVLCEKPLAATVEDCEEIIGRAREKHCYLQAGLELRFAPWVNDLSDVLGLGELGTARSLWCKEYRPPFKSGQGGWRLDSSSSGGTLVEKCVHHFDLFNLFAASAPLSVYGVGFKDTIYSNTDTLDRASVVVEYENGVTAHLDLALFYHEFTLEFGVLCNGGMIRVDGVREFMEVHSARKHWNVQHETHVGGQVWDHPGEVSQVEDFVRGIQEGRSTDLHLNAVLLAHRLAFAAEEAVKNRLPIRLDNKKGA